jgi:hypothetical protein
MLKITDSAADVLRQVRTEAEVPEGAAVRIQLVPDEARHQQVIGFAFTARPEAGDQPVAEDPKVFVAQELAAPLTTSVLDTRETDSGTELELREQTSDNGQV